MPVDVQFKVRSNIDALDHRTLHDAFFRMVDESMFKATAFLEADRHKHDRSGLTSEHIRTEHPPDVGDTITAKLGITPVLEKDDRPTSGRYKHSQAPIFVDAGTRSPIFPKRAPAMWNMNEGIFGRRSVSGQHGQHFMAKTLAELQLALRTSRSVELALKEMSARASAQLPRLEA